MLTAKPSLQRAHRVPSRQITMDMDKVYPRGNCKFEDRGKRARCLRTWDCFVHVHLAQAWGRTVLIWGVLRLNLTQSRELYGGSRYGAVAARRDFASPCRCALAMPLPSENVRACAAWGWA